jgi:hypothetical protein
MESRRYAKLMARAAELGVADTLLPPHKKPDNISDKLYARLCMEYETALTRWQCAVYGDVRPDLSVESEEGDRRKYFKEAARRRAKAQ